MACGTRMLATGEAPDKAIAAISKRFNVSKQNAGRVVMTESTYFSSAAQKDCFNELGVEKYRIIGTLDTKTCNICGDMDGKVFKMSDYRPDSTAPPFHPWCRCCTAPYFDDMDGVGERYARDAKTGERYKLPKDTTYNEWKAMQDAAYGSGTVDKLRKIGYNESADKSQFERYKEWLGSNAPKTFEAFQKLKYDNPELWESYKTLARSKNYLQQKLNYVWNGEKCFIPKHTKFEKVVTMAGKDTDTAIRCVDRLVETYGDKADEWQKRAGKVTSDKYIFDLHWYESDGVQYEVKLKNRKERKRNEN